jgi:hypothetical protein
VKLPADELAALLVTTSFAAGLNLYATTATLGLLSRFGVLDLPPTLHLLNTWPVIVVSLALFAVEFFADKVPAFDLIWNALHTFIRVPIAALLAYRATAQLSPTEQVVAAALGGVIALAAHGGKTAVRAAITPSPEPLSNIGLSFWRRRCCNRADMVRDPPSVYCRGHRPVAAHRHYRSGAMDCACIEGIVPRSEYAHRQRHKAAVLMPAISGVENNSSRRNQYAFLLVPKSKLGLNNSGR